MKLPSDTNAPLFDPAALHAHRKRAQASALFLHHMARDEVKDRLDLVNKRFTRPAIVTPFPSEWEDLLPGAACVQDTDTLDLEVGAHDLVIHAMCLHWANDPVGQIIQCHRALVADGLFLGVCLGGQTLGELRRVLTQAEIDISGGLSPRLAPMPEIRDLGSLLQRAGLALPVADSFVMNAEYRDLWHLMHDLRAMGETNALSARLRHPTRRAVFARAQDLYATQHSTKDNRLTASFELICLTGWSPDPSQQQPLRPGSAQARLADAIGAKENNLPD